MFDLLGFVRFLSVVGKRKALVVANLYWSQIWCSLLNFIYPRVQVAWVEHNTYLNRSKMQWRVFRLLSKRASILLTVSEEIEDFVRDQALCQTKVVSNAARAHFQRISFSLENPKFLLIGRLVVQKNPALALVAFKSAISSGIIPADSKLIVIGEGPLETNFKNSSTEYGIDLNVEFPGFLDSHEVSRIMSESHVLVMASHHEGSPLVRLEALAHGMTIVTTKTAGIKGILTEPDSENLLPGVFVCDDNPEILSTSLGRALDKIYWSSESVASRLVAAKKFHPTSVAEEYMRLLIL